MNAKLLSLFRPALAAVALAATLGAVAQPEPSLPRESIYKGYKWRVDEEGDTVAVYLLRDLVVFPPERFKNKKQEDFYRQTVADVRATLPYAKLIAATLVETYEYISTFDTKEEREAYLKDMEKALFDQYKPILRKFSKRRAKVLIKLVQRETNQTGYDIVKAFLGTGRATFWQGFGKLFGVSLKAEYNPKGNEADATMERIATLMEQGAL